MKKYIEENGHTGRQSTDIILYKEERKKTYTLKAQSGCILYVCVCVCVRLLHAAVYETFHPDAHWLRPQPPSRIIYIYIIIIIKQRCTSMTTKKLRRRLGWLPGFTESPNLPEALGETRGRTKRVVFFSRFWPEFSLRTSTLRVPRYRCIIYCTIGRHSQTHTHTHILYNYIYMTQL